MNHESPFHDTIFALSSGALPSGVAVIRLSGPQVRDAIIALTGDVPPARKAVLRYIFAADGTVLDRGLLLFFPGPASFTGEDCAEFQIHGGPAVAAAILSAAGGISGLRQAEAGEFSRRAFINGKIDLTGAEGLADLIAAETEAQRQLAMRNADGGQKKLYETWRTSLLHARALIEAELDFSDEGDVTEAGFPPIIANLQKLADEIQQHIDGFAAAEIIKDGFKVVLIGAPNAGKSTLLNALAKREVAIVTDIPGTTRDLIEVSLDIQGIKVLITDTAGIRITNDKVEKIGVTRAMEAAENADLVLLLIERSEDQVDLDMESSSVPFIVVGTKIDIRDQHLITVDHRISAVTGEGLEGLIDDIGSRAQIATMRSSNVIPTRLRHVELLKATRESLLLACNEHEIELQAEQLRQASASLGRITGAIDVEELLGVIFSEFCIGK